MEFKDYYAELGVAADSSEAEIKSAFRKLARKYHPDVSKEGNAEDRFKAVNEAYEVLRDRDKRAAYDQLRARGYRPGDEFNVPPDFGQGGFGRGGHGQGFEFDLGDIFSRGQGAGGAGFSDFFESLFGGAQQRRPHGPAQPHGRPPQPRRARVQVPLEAVHDGGAQRIQVDGRTLEVKIPAGVREGQSIRLAGQGGQGADLLLEIAYAAHPDFSIEGKDVIYELRLAPWEAALGVSLSVPTLGGAVTLKVPAGSGSGRRLRLRGRGLPGDPPGNQYVELQLETPPAQSEQQIEAYRVFEQAFPEFDARTA
ncbi:MAG: DnaJ domain-containing protein [Xanthomonadales bacterium]|nr:DnaJ domain-containing protein [Xanthomonadales bacterium]